MADREALILGALLHDVRSELLKKERNVKE